MVSVSPLIVAYCLNVPNYSISFQHLQLQLEVSLHLFSLCVFVQCSITIKNLGLIKMPGIQLVFFLFTMYFVGITRFVEPVTIEVTVINPLKVTLVLREIELLWRFVPDEDANAQTKLFSNEVEFGKVIISIDY